MTYATPASAAAIEPAPPPKPNPLRRFQDKLCGSFGRDKDPQQGADDGGGSAAAAAPPDGGHAADSDSTGVDRQPGRLSPRGASLARLSTEPNAQQPALAAHALGHLVGQAARHQVGIFPATCVVIDTGASDC